MKEFIKNNLTSVLVVISTLLLGGVAIFTAIRLFELRNEPVEPNAPTNSFASEPDDTIISCDVVTIQLATATASPTTTPIPTDSPTSTPTSTSAPTFLAVASATPQTQLLDAGISIPTIIGSMFGLLLLFGAALLAI